MNSLVYKLTSGKPIKILYFIRSYISLIIPRWWEGLRARRLLKNWKSRPDADYIADRVGYYNRLDRTTKLPNSFLNERHPSYYVYVGPLGRFKPATFHKAYFFDLQYACRSFPKQRIIGYIPGDVYFTPEFPALVKSRLLTSDNANSVVLKLDKLRHFMRVADPVPLEKKKPVCLFRGKIRHSRLREKFMKLYFGHPMCDCGIVGKNEGWPEEWMVPKMTIRQHLDYMFIMALEGNDVASNLKWVMSSNSIAVMTRPTCETWFMEGRLEPGRHYILIKDDLSDLEEQLNYYINHPDEAQAIVENAHAYVEQFFDKRREKLISLLVAEKYFQQTGQSDEAL